MKTIAAVWFGALALICTPTCSTISPQVKTAVADCAADLGVTVLADVSTGLDTSQSALEAAAIKYGIEVVKCAVVHFLADEKLTASIGPNPRVENGHAFLKAHP